MCVTNVIIKCHHSICFMDVRISILNSYHHFFICIFVLHVIIEFGSNNGYIFFYLTIGIMPSIMCS
jgi:hypothetical protein